MKKLLLIALACLPSALCVGGDPWSIQEAKEYMRQFGQEVAVTKEKQGDKQYKQENKIIQEEHRQAQLRKLQAEQQKK